MGEIEKTMAYEITNQNDMFFFFEMVKRTEPDSILDIGLFLQRIGAVSRQVKNMEIPSETTCDGMPLSNQQFFPVSTAIYQSIVDLNSAGNYYDMISIIGITDLISVEDEAQLWNWLSSHAHCVIADCRQPERLQMFYTKGICTDYQIDDDTYAMIVLN